MLLLQKINVKFPNFASIYFKTIKKHSLVVKLIQYECLCKNRLQNGLFFKLKMRFVIKH